MAGIFHKEVLNFMWDLKFHVGLVIFIYFFNLNLTSATFGGSTSWVQPASFHRWHTSKWLMNLLCWWFFTMAFCEIASMGKCLFDDNWLEDEKYRGWLKKTASNHEARFALCKKTIKLGTIWLGPHCAWFTHEGREAQEVCVVVGKQFAHKYVLIEHFDLSAFHVKQCLRQFCECSYT